MARCARMAVVLMMVVASGSMVCGQNYIFTFIAPDSTIHYDQNGAGNAVIGMLNVEDPASPGFPNEVEGWAMGNMHDSNLLTVTEVEQGEYIQNLNNGSGPDFWSAIIHANGFTIGCVYSYPGLGTCTYEVPKEVAQVTYATVEPTLAGDEDGETTLLQFVNTLGNPPVQNVMVVDGVGWPMQFDDGTVELVYGLEYARGDCNSSGSIDVSDPVYLQNYLFLQFQTPPCFDACDHNDDGALDIADVIYLLGYLFAQGPPPPPPFPECGTDPTNDALDCAGFGICP